MTQQQAVAAPPIPKPDPSTQFFWDAVNDHKLMILRCQACQHYIHYPRPICNKCRSTDLKPEEVSGRGTVYSHTVVVQPFHPYWADKVPYILAVVELEEQPGLRLTTTLVDCKEGDVKHGTPVEVVYQEIWPGVTLPHFKPAATAG